MLHLPNSVQIIVVQLPLEIQCVVLKFTIWSYLTENTEDWELIDEYFDLDTPFNRRFETRLLKRPLHCLYGLCGCDEPLDSIVIKVIQELVFDSAITDSPDFKSFVDYIISKSVKIHMISTREIAGFVNDETRFFDHGCLKFEANYRVLMHIKNLNYMCHITSLTCDLVFLDEILRKIQPQDMISLTEIRIVMDAELKRGISDPMIVLEYHPEWVQKIAELNIRLILEIRLSENFSDVEDLDEIIEDFIDIFEGFEIKIDPRSSFYPSLDYMKGLIDRNMNHPWFFRTDLSERGLKVLSDANNVLNLKELGVQFLYAKSLPFQSITFSNPSIEALSLYSIEETELNILFENMLSLKELTLRDGSISLDFLNRLPETLHKLTIWCVDPAKSSRHDVNLPTHLQSLVVRAYGDGLTTFEIGNSDELVNLREVSLCLEYSNYTDEQLRPFIYSFPASVNCLNLRLYGRNQEIKIDDRDYSGLGLNELPCLKFFSLKTCDLNGFPIKKLNLFWLPPSHCIQIGKFASLSLEGQFPKTLKSLDINLKFWGQSDSFPKFWKRYISPLENLYSLKARIDGVKYVDFRGLEFPKHLHTIEWVTQKYTISVSFDYIPSSLKTFFFTLSDKDYFYGDFVCARKYKHKVGSDSFHDREQLNQVFYASSPCSFEWKLEGEPDFAQSSFRESGYFPNFAAIPI
ncbi:unnamed protein product [Ambrosiozyma monospora]|uniref:Unnamed protein product n=1 Tax=Ambrosiozyma monospora TaxID=43982 RepID=A0ACB5T0I3_AMBMO|nr:unnamed protein product [Ambrosiozyma monospora]